MSEQWKSAWTDITPLGEVTLHIDGAVSRHPKVSGVYVTLRFGPTFTTTMHDVLARQLRDWLNANVPD